MSTVISLCNSEMLICQAIATLRNTCARSNGVKDQRVDNKMTPIEIDFIGIVAEMAWHKWRGTYPDLSVAPQQGTFDAVFMGKTIDIKATTYKQGKLLATLKKTMEASDVYVLAIVDKNQVEFVGYATNKELISDENITDLGRGNGYALPQNKLHKFKQ